jgi:uncharacterized protein (DUF58 family)
MIERTEGRPIGFFQERIPVPTTLAVGLAAAGIGIAFVLGWKGALVLDLLLLLGCWTDFAFACQGRAVSAKRRLPDYLSQETEGEVGIILLNEGNRPSRVQMRDTPPLEWEKAPIVSGTIPAGSSVTFSYKVFPRKRGIYRFGDIHLRVKGPFGLSVREVHLPSSVQVKVFPNLRAFRSPDLVSYRRAARERGSMRARWRGEGREFEALRDYTEGDDPRKIHWKASARLDRPIVQEFRPERNQNVILALDASRLMCALSGGKTKLDHALESAVQLAHAAMAGGDQPGIFAFSNQVIFFIPPKRSPDQLRRILEKTVSLEPRFVEPRYEEAFLWLRFRLRRRSLIVIFTDLLDEVASENLLEAVALLRARHLPLCVAVRESEWDRVMNQAPSTPYDVYERSVLQQSLRQRRKALGVLVQKGSLVTDLPPSRLSQGILERYRDVKRRGLL